MKVKGFVLCIKVLGFRFKVWIKFFCFNALN
jgi:hypothetical protein